MYKLVFTVALVVALANGAPTNVLVQPAVAHQYVYNTHSVHTPVYRTSSVVHKTVPVVQRTVPVVQKTVPVVYQTPVVRTYPVVTAKKTATVYHQPLVHTGYQYVY